MNIRNRTHYRVLFFITAASLLLSAGLYAREQKISPYARSVDVPEGFFGGGSVKGGSVSWTHESGEGIFQLLFMPAETHAAAEGLFAAAAGGLRATGDKESYTYEGRNAVFGDMNFIAAGMQVRGYLIAINQDSGYDIILLSYAFTESYDQMQPFLLSCLDSFSIDEKAALRPGPVSQFFYPFPGPQKKLYALGMAGKSLKVSVDPAEVDSSQVLIEREALVLADAAGASQDVRDEAWRRYYRLIFRDNLMRLYPVVQQIDALPGVRQLDDREFALFLLDWIQGFTYSRTGSFSDFLSPLETVLSMEGDCDSRGLLYVMLLRYFDLDAILMVSSVYSHSLAAVDIPGPGARFTFGGKQYLVAETTEKVDMGLIDAAMADPAGWLGVGF